MAVLCGGRAIDWPRRWKRLDVLAALHHAVAIAAVGGVDATRERWVVRQVLTQQLFAPAGTLHPRQFAGPLSSGGLKPVVSEHHATNNQNNDDHDEEQRPATWSKRRFFGGGQPR